MKIYVTPTPYGTGRVYIQDANSAKVSDPVKWEHFSMAMLWLSVWGAQETLTVEDILDATWEIEKESMSAALRLAQKCFGLQNVVDQTSRPA